MAKKSKPSFKERQICLAKVVYYSRQMALMKSIQLRLPYYRCPVCKHYHLTSQGADE